MHFNMKNPMSHNKIHKGRKADVERQRFKGNVSENTSQFEAKGQLVHLINWSKAHEAN